MQEIVLCRLENWIGDEYVSNKMPYVIVGQPCETLQRLQDTGHCVLAELAHLQGLSEEEVAEALCSEKAVQQFENVCIHAAELPQAYLRRIWCRSQGQPVLIAETEHLIIRESIEADAEAFLELYSDAECRKYLEVPAMAGAEARQYADIESREQRVAAYRRYIADYRKGQYAFYEYGMWTVVEKAGGAVVGRAGLEQQTWEGSPAIGLGYAISPRFRGRGYAVEACLAILRYCKECEYAETVYAIVDAGNTASRKVFDRLKKGRDERCAAVELILK